jgi:CIC family chloride channel protein
LRGRGLAARLVAAIATLGSGAPLGLEGPSLYAGASIGAIVQRRLPRPLRALEPRTLLVAGAAAGVAAVFKAPATGAVFALEVPYRDDLARRLLLPSLVAAATGYLTFVAIDGTEPLFHVVGDVRFGVRDLGGALLLGVLCGLGARAFSCAVRLGKRWAARPTWQRLALAAPALAAAVVAGDAVGGERLVLGSGHDVVGWLGAADRGAAVVLALLALRCVGTALAVAGGGVGGLFIPLVAAGALTGSLAADVVGSFDRGLFTVVGVAAFLGAGYRVPLAAVTFVAETTGRPGYVVPGLLAAVAAELVVGSSSVTAYQRGPSDADGEAGVTVQPTRPT